MNGHNTCGCAVEAELRGDLICRVDRVKLGPAHRDPFPGDIRSGQLAPYHQLFVLTQPLSLPNRKNGVFEADLARPCGITRRERCCANP